MDAYRFIHHFINEIKYENITDLDHNKVTKKFQQHLKDELNDKQFIDLLIYSGFIPDVYANDSSEEKLHTKLTESLVAEWARRLGLDYIIPTQKSGKEDVTIKINNDIVVADAKSFRLGRSQSAPNHKDFLKLESISSWMNKHENSIGGLITFPYTHDWKTRSNVYEECTNKRIPTLILTYIHMAYILNNKHNFNSFNLKELWNYERIFPQIIRKKGGNRDEYWEKINSEIVSITNTNKSQLNQFISESKDKKQNYIKEILEKLENHLKERQKETYDELEKMSTKEIKDLLVSLRIKDEEEDLKKRINNIKDYRFD